MSIKDDLLLKAAKKYHSLNGSKLIITLGKKGTLSEIIVDFQASNFYHLAGLHKLKDIQAVRGYNTTNVLNKVLKGKLTNAMIEKSSFYDDMKERLEIISEFPDILKSNKVIWKFNKVRITRWTKIRWDYLIDYGIGNNETYVFLKTKGDDNHCFCISAFRKTDDYTKIQVRMTVLKVVLTNDKGDGKTIYQRKG